jgi:hypothetical protein
VKWVDAPFEQARPLLWLGMLGLTLAALCSVKALFAGLIIRPEGDLTKAITFDGAVGIYVLTIGCLASLAGFTPRGRRRWIGWAIGLTLYAYGVETVQTLRGLDPRFSHHFTALDQVAGTVFGVVAIGLIVHFSVLALKLVSRPIDERRDLVLLAIRYACLSVMIAFAAGLWMIVIQGRRTGMAGNILPLHAAGFHGLQAIPIVALLFARSTLPDQFVRRWTHAAGLAWVAMCVAIGWQTIAGRPPLEGSGAMVFAAVGAAIWMVCALVAAYAWRHRVSPAPVRLAEQM